MVLADGKPAYVQNSYSLLDYGDEEDVLPLCADHGIAYQAFAPLAGGWTNPEVPGATECRIMGEEIDRRLATSGSDPAPDSER